MESASEALIMAGQILIFIIALTVCISSFTNARAEADILIGEDETVEMAKNGEQYVNYLKSEENGAIRVVNADAVVSSMYRILKGDYTIYIKLKNYDSLNNSHVTIANATKNISVNGSNIINAGERILKASIGRNANQNVSEVLNDGKLYSYIKDKNFSEYIGAYKDYTDSGVSLEEKTERRIITYIEI